MKIYKYLLLSCLGFIFLSNSLFAQSGLSVYVANGKSDFGRNSIYELQNYLREIINADYLTSNNANIKVIPVIKSKGGSMIEAMETVTSSEVEIKIIFEHSSTNLKDHWSKTFPITGSNLNQIARDSIQSKIIENGTVREEILASLDKFINEKLSMQCTTIMASAEKRYMNGKVKEAISTLTSIPYNSSCDAQKEDLIKQYINEYQTEICEKNFHESQLLVASGDYRRAINLLRSIGYNAPCKEDVIKLAQQIGKERGAESIILNLSRPNDQAWYRETAIIIGG